MSRRNRRDKRQPIPAARRAGSSPAPGTIGFLLWFLQFCGKFSALNLASFPQNLKIRLGPSRQEPADAADGGAMATEVMLCSRLTRQPAGADE